MGKMQVCRICRSEKDLKYTPKELRLLNKQQLLLAQAGQRGQENSKASKKLLLTTPILGNICRECDDRLQIFHRLDDHDDSDNCSDIEVDVVSNTTNNTPLHLHLGSCMPKEDVLQRKQQRPETPVIVDDSDMLYNIFMQKIDQQRQFRTQHRTNVTMIEQQNQQFENEFHAAYTPPQSSAGGSEGDESKVIEILTSRESTPSSIIAAAQPPETPSLVDKHGHRIVAIIELDDSEENESTNTAPGVKSSGLLTPVTNSSNDLSVTHNQNCGSPTTALKTQNYSKQSEDDEEIVFRKVDSERDNLPAIKKRKRKSYDDKQLRLVASLSLLSSDSETEGEPAKELLSEKENKAVSKNEQNSVTCNLCKIKFPDSESLSVHENIHQGEKCIMCQVGFSQTKRLIHHMRCRHRSYNGNVLSEKPRSGQDSWLTIRLRYRQRTTFYECQLCGRIDEVFKEHKYHIMEKHANESKSLKDPIMKELKCPVCKAKCGAQYLSLCRHLIATHAYQEYKSHLRELVHVSAFGWNAARQQEVAKTAKIYQFIKRKTFFFACKSCSKVVAGYLNHLRHVNNHKEAINDKNKAICLPKTPELLGLNNTNVNESVKDVEKSKTYKAKQTSKELLKSNKEISEKGTRKVLKTYKISKPHSNLSAQLKPNDKGTKSSECKTKIQIKINLKPKDIVKNKQCVAKLTKVRPKKNSGSSKNKDNEKGKLIKGKAKDNIQKPQVVKVKVKAPIRQIELQKFKCRYCLKKFKGFRIFNLHLLQQHKDDEYCKCSVCNKTFKNCSSILEEHKKHCTTHVTPLPKRKSQTSNIDLTLEKCCSSESSKKEVPETCQMNSNIEVNSNYQWLQDLLKLNNSSKVSNSNCNATALYTNNNINRNFLTNIQCCYCLHLFTDENTLNKHINERHSEKEDIFIKYKPLQLLIPK